MPWIYLAISLFSDMLVATDMGADLKVGSVITEDLATKYDIGSMIQSDPMVRDLIGSFDIFLLDLESHRSCDGTDGIASINIRPQGIVKPNVSLASGFILFLDKLLGKSYEDACWTYTYLNEICNILKKRATDT